MRRSMMLLAALLLAGAVAGASGHQREIDEWVRQASVNVVTRGDAEAKVKHWMRELIDDAMHEAGVANDQIGGVLFRYVAANDTTADILTAVMDGNRSAVIEKAATYVANGIAEAKGVENVGDVIDIGLEAVHEDGKAKDRAVAAYKAALKKLFPYVDTMSKFSELVESCADIWVASDLEDAYQKVYRPKVEGEEGNIRDEDWSALYAAYLRGSGVRAAVKGMSEAKIREHFRQRYANEKKIAKMQNELQRLTEVWKKLDLLDSWRFPKGMDTPTRLKQLYGNYEMLRRMLTRGGKLMKGEFGGLSDREFMDMVMERWYETDNDGKRDKNHEKFYAWLKKIGIPPSVDQLKKNQKAKKPAAKPKQETKQKQAVKTKPAPMVKGCVTRVAEEWSNHSLKTWNAFSGGVINPKSENDGSGPYTRRAYSGTVGVGETISVDAKMLACAAHTVWDEWNTLTVWITGNDSTRNVELSKKSGTMLPSLSGSYVVGDLDGTVTATIMAITEWWHPMGGGNNGTIIKVKYKVVR